MCCNWYILISVFMYCCWKCNYFFFGEQIVVSKAGRCLNSGPDRTLTWGHFLSHRVRPLWLGNYLKDTFSQCLHWSNKKTRKNKVVWNLFLISFCSWVWQKLTGRFSHSRKGQVSTQSFSGIFPRWHESLLPPSYL